MQSARPITEKVRAIVFEVLEVLFIEFVNFRLIPHAGDASKNESEHNWDKAECYKHSDDEISLLGVEMVWAYAKGVNVPCTDAKGCNTNETNNE